MKLNKRGFTLIELTAGMGLMVLTGLWVTGAVRRSTAIFRTMWSFDSQQASAAALKVLVGDLKEADATSINWDMVPGSSLTFKKRRFDEATGSFVASSQFQYRLEFTGPKGRLVRVQDGVAKTLLQNIWRPGDFVPSLKENAPPLFQVVEPLSHLMDVRMIHQPTMQGDPVTLMYRVSVDQG